MRGDVYELKSPKGAKGHEQRGKRYCVIVQSDELVLSTVIVVPTSASARPNQTFRPQIVVGSDRTTALVDQMIAVDAELALGQMVGRINLQELQRVDDALRLVLEV